MGPPVVRETRKIAAHCNPAIPFCLHTEATWKGRINFRILCCGWLSFVKSVNCAPLMLKSIIPWKFQVRTGQNLTNCNQIPFCSSFIAPLSTQALLKTVSAKLCKNSCREVLCDVGELDVLSPRWRNRPNTIIMPDMICLVVL